MSGLREGLASSPWDNHLTLSIINICVIAFNIIGLIVYYNHRQQFPIKGRGTNAIVTGSLIFLIQLVNSALSGPSWPCAVQVIIFSVCSHCACLTYAHRMVILIVKSDIATEIRFGSAETIITTKLSWLRHPKFLPFLKFKRWIYVIGAYGVLIGTIFAIAVLAEGDEFGCTSTIFAVWANLSLFVIMLSLFSVLGWQLRKFPADGRKIFVEFRMMASCIILSIVAQIVLAELVADDSFVNLLVLDIVGIALFLTGMVFPVCLTYRSYVLGPDHSSVQRGLAEWLEVEQFREAFLVHLKREFNAESLVFWQAVTTFKSKGERPVPEMIEDIQEIFRLYLLPSAPYQLNTSLNSIEATQQLFKDAQATGTGFLNVCDTLLNEVLTLMKSDPLPRFLQTPVGREFLTHGHSGKSPAHGDQSSQKRRSDLDD